MPFGPEQIERFSKRFAPLAPYYAIHGSGALTWHLQHRMVDELDFFIEPDSRDEAFGGIVFTALCKLVPMDVALQMMPDFDVKGVVKLQMSNILLSFVQTPKFNGTRARANEDDAMAIASLDELIGGKFYALGNRDSNSDYHDLAAILEHRPELTPREIMALSEAGSSGDTNHAAAFGKLAAAPSLEGLSEEDRSRLQQFGQAGLLIAA